MPDLIEKSPEASVWMAEALAAHAGGDVFGRLASSVIWSNATDANGRLLVPVDPIQLAAKVNAEPFPLLLGHDPGRPMGQVLSAKTFGSPPGEVFVAAVLGFYEGGRKLGFGYLGLDVAAAPPPANPKDSPRRFCPRPAAAAESPPRSAAAWDRPAPRLCQSRHSRLRHQ